MKRSLLAPLCLLLAVTLSGRSAADTFPPVTDAERALTSVPGEPNAPAVILSKNAELLMMGYSIEERVSSRLLVKTRIKILTEAGKSQGEVVIFHGDQTRLVSFQGRTVLADGRVVPVPSDAKFKRKVSRREKRSVTSIAFPSVEVGAILDYQYELRFDSIFFLEPWYLASELPALHSEITYKMPGEIQARVWTRDPYKIGIQNEMRRLRSGTEARYWADNLPSVPDEPLGVPFADLAAQVSLIPAIYDDGVQHTLMLNDWPSTCKLIGEEQYDKARRKDGGVKKAAKEIAAAADPGGKDARVRAEFLYRFVRDKIETVDAPGVMLAEGSSVEHTLAQKSGDSADKAMLLQSLLQAVGIDARLVWAANRWRGQVDTALPNPAWFDTVLVAADVGGQRFYLDPSDRALAFGRLSYAYETTPALLHDNKKPEGVLLPETPFDQNLRRAVVDLTLAADGSLSGKGEMTLTGQHAWERIDWQDSQAEAVEAWKKWLTERYRDFKVDGVEVQESPDDETVRLAWTLEQRKEEALGDESSLAPSRPIGPFSQPFVQEGAKRRSPVLLAYGDRDEVEMRLHWPGGWRVESKPAAISRQGRAGSLAVSVDVDDAARSLVYHRRIDVPKRQLGSLQQFEELRALYADTEKSDAQSLVLVRR